MKRIVAAFDFDGTLTRRDTLLPFLSYCIGRRKLGAALLRNALWIAAYKLKLYSNARAKERLFSACLKGFSVEKVREKAEQFAVTHAHLLRPETTKRLQELAEIGASIYIVTASMELWVRPLLETAIKSQELHYLTTQPEVCAGKLTGCFATPNCYGKEKVRRLLAAEPRREEYWLYAFGDSRGDSELLALADYPFYRTFYEKS